MAVARAARATALLLVLFAAGPVAASRPPPALGSPAHAHGFRRSLRQEQSGCCALVDATATGGTVACGATGLVLTVPSAEFAPISANLTVTGKSGNTAVVNTAALAAQTCSPRFGAATWGSAGGATTLAVAAGTDNTCAIGTEGTCTGYVTSFGPFTTVGICMRHACGIRASDGAVLCSGNNAFGPLGTGTTTASTSLAPVLAPSTGTGILTGAKHVATGGRTEAAAPSGHTCACLSSGQAVCWGQNTWGQLGAGISTSVTTVTRPVPVVTDAAGTTPLANCKYVAANLNHTLFLTTDGSIYAAGRNGYSELGLGTASVINYAAKVTPDRVANKVATDICAGKRHSCAVFADNTVACVGGNGNGQLGQGITSPIPTPDWGFVAGIDDAVEVQCGELSTCVLRKGGKVSCWGLPLAVGNNGAAALTPFETLSGGAVKIAAGDQHVCAIMDDASVKCWGRGSNGQLADGQATPPSAWPTPTTSTFVGAVSIHAGGHSTCIIDGLGQRLCAGTNALGQLAIASSPTSVTITSPTPAGTSFAAPPAFVTVSAGSAPVCTLMLTVEVDATCDPTPPVFNQPLENIAVDATSAAGAVVSFDPTAENDGVPVAVTCTPASDSVFPLGDTNVTCTAGVTKGTFVVTVARTAPAISANAPSDPFEANTNYAYLGASLAGLYAPQASDPVDGDLTASIKTFLVSTNQQITLSGASAYIFPLGPTQIKNAVTNSAGLTAEELVTIRVIDTTKPVLTVDATPIAVTQAPNAAPQIIGWPANKCTATDLANVTITYSPASGGAAGVAPFLVPSTTTVTCTATDSSGNTATGTFTVTVQAPPPPTFGPGPSGPFEATTSSPYIGTTMAGKYAPTATDPSTGADLSASIQTFLVSTNQQITLSGASAYLFPLGSTQIKNAVTSSFGVSAEQVVTVTVVDTTLPAITVKGNIQLTNPSPAPRRTVRYPSDQCTATDLLPPVTVTYNPPSGTSFATGMTHTVTCTATDASGNQATATFTVTVRDPVGTRP